MNADFYGGMESHQPIPENQDFAGVMVRYNRGTIPPASHTEDTLFKKEPGNIDDNDFVTGEIAQNNDCRFSFFIYDKDENYSSTVHLTLDTTIPDQIQNLAAVSGDGQVGLSWNNPDENFVGVKVVYSTVSAPNNYLEGTVIYDGTGSSYLHNRNVNNGRHYYYSAFTYKNVNTYSFPVSITATPQANPNTNQPPVVHITGSVEGEANSVVNFTRTANDSDGQIVASHWDFGDGNGSNNWSTTTHIYAQPGQYIVIATAQMMTTLQAQIRFLLK